MNAALCRDGVAVKTKRITRLQVRHTQMCAERRLGLLMTEAHARKVLKLAEPDVLGALGRNFDLDTADRDYFAMAVIESFLPGAPSETDDLLGERQEYWHWPLIGSGRRYSNAFYQAFLEAMNRAGVRVLAAHWEGVYIRPMPGPLTPPVARLLELVDADGRSRGSIASAAGMSAAQLSQVLTGHRADPSITTVGRILAAIGKTWGDLDPPKAKPKRAKKPR